ncbi:exopolysaccharide biosynthesis protein [Microbulbifer spongiae]|uniref:Exopolysaccharide biosynthesis protein n=1 Tax=Microbulbifer spongiae TaxID=2944933 RepID=A0ABY9EFV6_9GAMM|nr:exopolysaccharide biosynthesis protein [Microbulbifer sp. MI-G]WKD51311.1 exopolysaccharide biosynthesis protein [Microbulbifer sp. MI-G]
MSKCLGSNYQSQTIAMADEITGLSQLLDQIETSSRHSKRISLQLVIEAIGLRSFAPFLLLVGLILFSPLSGVPGVSSAMAALLLLVAIQLLLGRRHVWLPQWLLRRSISKGKLNKALNGMKKPAEFADRWMQPRLDFLVRRGGTYAIAAICSLIALAIPLMEPVPFSATTAGFALTIFGLALVSHDGLLALMAFAVTALLTGLLVSTLL